MHLLRRFEHEIDPSLSTGAVLRRAAHVLAAVGHRDVQFHVFLSELEHRQVSAIARLIDRHPSLVSAGAGTPRILASLPVVRDAAGAQTSWSIVPLDLATALELADGIPDRYAFFQSHFYVTPVPALELIAAPRRTHLRTWPQADHPEIVVHSAGTSSRRVTGVRSAVACAAPAPDNKRPPALPASIKALLDALGRPDRETQELVRTAKERAVLAARHHQLAPRIAALTSELEASWAQLAFPHDLVDDHRHAADTVDLRRVLAESLRPAGWHQVPGGFRLRSPGGCDLMITYDRKPLGNDTWASLLLRGGDWRHAVALWPRPTSRMVRIRSPWTAARYADNIAAAAAHTLATWAAPIEALYGPSDDVRPPW